MGTFCSVWFLATTRWMFFLQVFCRDILPSHPPKAMDSTDYGLKSLKSWARENLSSKLFFSRYFISTTEIGHKVFLDPSLQLEGEFLLFSTSLPWLFLSSNMLYQDCACTYILFAFAFILSTCQVLYPPWSLHFFSFTLSHYPGYCVSILRPFIFPFWFWDETSP